MTRKSYLGLFLAGLAIAVLAASLEHAPGYMDADYYFAGALRLVEGWSNEPYLWNYLNDPPELLAPAFSYWMPLTSLLAAAGLVLAKPLGFLGARLGFILLAALVPPLTSLLSYRLTSRPDFARLAGVFALFPGFYLAYQTTTDVFPIYMVLGGLFVLLAFERDWPLPWSLPFEIRLAVLGILAGLFHLARADGILWLVGGFGVAFAWYRGFRTASAAMARPAHWAVLARSLAAVLAGYILVLWPWYARNLRIWGSLFPPGGSRTLWLTAYEETMIYPANLLTPSRWLAAEFGGHLTARLEALSANLQTTLAIQGGIVLLPFILAALWKLRGCAQVRLGVGLWLLTFGLMTFVFPYAGTNGAYFHSGAALQPLFWALAPVGIERVMLAYARWRRIGTPLGMVKFTATLLVLVGALLSILLYYQRVIGSAPDDWQWTASDRHYRQVEQVLVDHGAAPSDAVLVNNPPGYWLAARRAAAVIPDGDENTMIEVAQRYGIRYVVLERNNPSQLAPLYDGEISPPELEFLASVGTTRLYRVVEQE